MDWEYNELLKVAFIVGVGYFGGKLASDFFYFILKSVFSFFRVHNLSKKIEKDKEELVQTLHTMHELNQRMLDAEKD